MKMLILFLLLLVGWSEAEACQLFHDVAQDTHGNVIAGVTVTVRRLGTTGSTTIYSDSECATTQDNPTSSDVAGGFSFYVPDGEYSVTFAKTGFTFTDLPRISLYDALGENTRTVGYYPTSDICSTGSGAIDAIGSTPITLVINKAVTCSASKTIPTTLKLQFQGAGQITIAIGQVLTMSEPSVIISTSKQQIFAGNGTVSFTTSGAVYPRWWGVTGTADDVAINAAIASVPSNSTIFLEGSYTTSDTILVNKDRVHLVGIGAYGTTIYFAPTADGTAIKVDKSGSVAFQGSIRDLAVYSDDSAFTKVAIDLVDTSGWSINNVSIGGSVAHGGAYYWSGGTGSIGIQTHGREFGLVRNLYNYADKPIRISDNPNHAIDVDHFNFQDCYLSAYGYPVVTIDDGVNLSNVSFIGAQPWVGGTYGLYWSDTTTSIVSNNLRIENVRWEQTNDATKYMVYISHNYELQGFSLVNVFGLDRKGFYLRKVSTATFDTVMYANGTLEALNVDSTVKRLEARNSFWEAGSTASVTGQTLVWSSPLLPNTAPLPPDFLYTTAANTKKTMFIGTAIAQPSVSLADSANSVLGDGGMSGLLFISESNDVHAVYAIQGGNHSTAELLDNSGQFSVTKDAATSTNIYWDAGDSNYHLQNKTTFARIYRFTFVGSYDTIY